MLEREIRLALRQRLHEEHERSTTLVRDELGLCLGEARVDIAVVNRILMGYEIKSSRDRLHRLPGQVRLYGRVLDSAVLVTAGCHLNKAMAVLPGWWGVWRAEQREGVLVFDQVREPARNLSTDPTAVVQLLWRDEALALLGERSLACGLRSATRWRLWEAIVEHLEPDDIAHEVRQRLRVRPAWSGG